MLAVLNKCCYRLMLDHKREVTNMNNFAENLATAALQQWLCCLARPCRNGRCANLNMYQVQSD